MIGLALLLILIGLVVLMALAMVLAALRDIAATQADRDVRVALVGQVSTAEQLHAAAGLVLRGGRP